MLIETVLLSTHSIYVLGEKEEKYTLITCSYPEASHLLRFWYLLHMCAVKAQMRLGIHQVLNPYFVHGSSKDSGECVHLHRLA